MHRNSNPFDPFLRIRPKVLHQSHYDWLVEQIRTHTGTACLIWPFATNRKGFGIIKVQGTRTSGLVHRLAFELANGYPAKECVVQTCRDRTCFAPDHLVDGPQSSPEKNPRPFKRYEWLRLQVAGHQSDECLLWPFAGTGPMDYGVLRTPLAPGYEYAHRVAFYLVHDRWPEPQTLHSCDVPRCFNPHHLSEGTHEENTADRVKKGRSGSPALKGMNHGRSKLSDAAVLEIRSSPLAHPKLAAMYGVHVRTIWRIKKRLNWNHL